MRRILMAALVLSPMLVHAQANQSAQPQAQVPGLQSKLVAPKELKGSENMVPTAKAVRISTGVEIPKLIYTTSVVAEGDTAWRATEASRTAVVAMIVDEKGVPTELKIMKSAGTAVDRNVLAAVAQYRFKPGTLNNQPTAIPVNLEVVMVSSNR